MRRTPSYRIAHPGLRLLLQSVALPLLLVGGLLVAFGLDPYR